jgi:hypothetical protein
MYTDVRISIRYIKNGHSVKNPLQRFTRQRMQNQGIQDTMSDERMNAWPVCDMMLIESVIATVDTEVRCHSNTSEEHFYRIFSSIATPIIFMLRCGKVDIAAGNPAHTRL